MQNIVWISLGAALGANLRHFVAQQVARLTAEFPFGTVIVNVTGSFLLGMIIVWTTDRLNVDPRGRLFAVVGFCGGYTTFSTFAVDTFVLWEQRRWMAAASNIVLSNALSLAGVVLGGALARYLR